MISVWHKSVKRCSAIIHRCFFSDPLCCRVLQMWVFCWIHVRRHTWLSHNSLFLKKTNKKCAIVSFAKLLDTTSPLFILHLSELTLQTPPPLCFIWMKNMLLVLIRLSSVRRNCTILCPLIRKSPLLSGLRTAKADSCENLLLLFQFKVVKIVHQRTPEVSRQAFRGLHLQSVCISLSQDKRGKERKPCGVFF